MERRYPEEHDDDGLSDDDDNHSDDTVGGSYGTDDAVVYEHAGEMKGSCNTARLLGNNNNNRSGDDDISNHLNKLSLHESESRCETVSHTDKSIAISTSENNESTNSCVNENTTVNDTVTDVQNISINDSMEGSLEDATDQKVLNRGPKNGHATSIMQDQRAVKAGLCRDDDYDYSGVPNKFMNPGPQPYPDTTPCYPSQQINSNIISDFNSFSRPIIQKPTASPDTTDTPDAVDDEEKRILAHRAVAALSTRDLLQADEDLDTELHSSVIDCDYYMVEALIDRYKRDETLDQVINAKNNNLQTPLCLSVLLNEPRIAELLIAEGADTNAIVRRTARASDGKPSASFDHLIHFSASRGDDWLKVLRHLLHSPTTKINSFNSEGQTAVHCAVLAHNKPPKDPSSKMTAGVINNIKTIAALSTAGANLNLPDQSSGKTPLHCAIEERDHDLVHKILSTAAHKDQQSENSLGSILSAKTNSGNTALHLAASVRMSEDAQIRLVRLLISKGADPSTKNGDGLLPRERAVYPAIVKLLKGSCSSPSSRYS